jgi:small-conductance mechanosensitive channel
VTGRILKFVGPNGAVQLFGVKLVGVNGENGRKFLFSLFFIALVWFLAWVLGKAAGALLRKRSQQAAFWTTQGIHLFSATALVIGMCSIWFSDPARLATAFGLVTAGLAFALQRVITAFAAYIVILRGKTFNIGDRIVMGGVRGDVIELGFIQTTLMEMGEPPSVQNADPAMWVRSRQYTGRIVTLTNDKIFDTPVYNYTREFPYIWEEMLIPVAYAADVKRAEEIMTAAATSVTLQFDELGESALAELERRYFVQRSELKPRVFMRLTDNWVELSVRFLVAEHGVREVKDKLSREILKGLNQAGIGVASGTYEIVGMPTISVKLDSSENTERQTIDSTRERQAEH